MAKDLGLALDDEFKALLDPLSHDEMKRLKANILRDGKVRVPLVAWDDGKQQRLVDGYSRYGIWRDLPDDTHVKTPLVDLLPFKNREEVCQWIVEEHLGRRNISQERRDFYLHRLLTIEKAKGNGQPTESTPSKPEEKGVSRHSGAKPPSPSGGRPKSPAARVAERAKVSKQTVQRADEWVKSLDRIRGVNAKAADDLKDGSLKADRKAVVAIAKLDNTSLIGQALKNLRNGAKWDTGIEAPATKPSAPKRKPTAQDIFKPLADAIGAAARKCDDVARKTGGQGAFHKKVMGHLNAALADAKAWKDDQK